MQINVDNLLLQMSDFRLNIKSWSLPSKSHLLIEGPSGSGKTTFLHLLSGLLPAAKGKIQVGDFHLQNLSAKNLSDYRREFCGIIFQKIHLLPHLNLKENVLLGCKNLSQQDSFESLMKSLDLHNRVSHRPSALSLGETQRAAVARALISEPEILFADEPTSGLDDKNAEKVFELIKKQSKNKTVLVVSHDYRARSFFDNKINFQELLK